jgi:aminoglycoside phosphotransferase (APT) family kinase protein
VIKPRRGTTLTGRIHGVLHGEDPVGLIDFDHVRPAPPVFDIACALEYAVPLRHDQECLRYSQPPDRHRRIEIFCGVCGISVPADITERGLDVNRRNNRAYSRTTRTGQCA